MFTAEQIGLVHCKVKSGMDFPSYIRDLKELGVTGYETFVTDGHTEFQGADNYKVSTAAKYPGLAIPTASDKEQFIKSLRMHQQGDTDYQTFCNDCAASGINKWKVCMSGMTCTYYDRAGNNILEEQIPR